LRAGAHGGRLARHFKALSSIGYIGAVDSQYRQVAIEKIADIDAAAVGAEGNRFGQGADRDRPDLGHFVSVDSEDRDTAACVVVKGCLWCIRPLRLDRYREVALGADRQPLGRIANRDVIDNPRRVSGEVNDSNRIDISIRTAAIAVIGGQRQSPVGVIATL
jgi:hypothetical protein